MSEPMWDERKKAWTERVSNVGVERAIYNWGHNTPEDFAAITQTQHAAIWPHFVEQLRQDDRHVLDFGCGYGRWTRPLKAAVDGIVLGVDPTAEMVDEATKRHGDIRGVKYAHITEGVIMDSLVPSGRFSVLWCCLSLSTILDPRMLRDELTHVRMSLRHDALVFIVDNTAGKDGSPVVSPYSISRTVDEYKKIALDHLDAKIELLGSYKDLGEEISIMAGRRYWL